MEADKDKMMREYRAQLDAERAQKLGRGREVVKPKSSSKKGKSNLKAFRMMFPTFRSHLVSYFLSLLPMLSLLTRNLNTEKKDKDGKKRTKKRRKVYSPNKNITVSTYCRYISFSLKIA